MKMKNESLNFIQSINNIIYETEKMKRNIITLTN